MTQVVRPGHVKGRAQLGLRFDELILPNGTTRHLRATLAGFGSAGNDKFKPKEGQIEGGGSKGKDAETVARTTIPGAEIGTIVGAAKGAPLEGLGIGSAAGAATGLVWVLAARGKDVVLAHGTSLDLVLSQPVTFDREDVGPPSGYDAGPTMPRQRIWTAQLISRFCPGKKAHRTLGQAPPRVRSVEFVRIYGIQTRQGWKRPQARKAGDVIWPMASQPWERPQDK